MRARNVLQEKNVAGFEWTQDDMNFALVTKARLYVLVLAHSLWLNYRISTELAKYFLHRIS